jgi:hypothetical protein
MDCPPCGREPHGFSPGRMSETDVPSQAVQGGYPILELGKETDTQWDKPHYIGGLTSRRIEREQWVRTVYFGYGIERESRQRPKGLTLRRFT